MNYKAIAVNAAVSIAAVFIGFQLPVIGDMLRKAAQKPVTSA